MLYGMESMGSTKSQKRRMKMAETEMLIYSVRQARLGRFRNDVMMGASAGSCGFGGGAS